jgi:hypothetical protein
LYNLKQDRCICLQGQETNEDRVILPPSPDVNTGDPEYGSAVLPTRPWFSAGGKVFEKSVYIRRSLEYWLLEIQQ